MCSSEREQAGSRGDVSGRRRGGGRGGFEDVLEN